MENQSLAYKFPGETFTKHRINNEETTFIHFCVEHEAFPTTVHLHQLYVLSDFFFSTNVKDPRNKLQIKQTVYKSTACYFKFWKEWMNIESTEIALWALDVCVFMPSVPLVLQLLLFQMKHCIYFLHLKRSERSIIWV